VSAIEGHCEAAFARVREVFVEQFERHPSGGTPENGASVSVVHAGRTVVDLWGGYRDEARTQPWQQDTVVMVASSTKGLTALVASRLVEQGLLDPEALVSRYWPEYGCAGKEGTRVEHLLTHQAGLPTLSEELAPGELWDWPRIAARFAAATPQYTPGTALGYHALSFGHLVGELVRRVSGRPVSELVREEIAGPLGIDVLMTVRDHELPRIAELCAPPARSMFSALGHLGDGTDFSTLTRYDDPRLLSAASANSLPWKRAGQPAAGAYTNARALARVYGALADGGALDGVRLLQPETIERLTRERVRGADRTLNTEAAYAFGWQKPATAIMAGAGARGFGHPGGWGSLGWGDPALRLGFGYAMNQTWAIVGDPRSVKLYEAAAACAAAA